MALHGGISGGRRKNQALPRGGKANELLAWVVFGLARGCWAELRAFETRLEAEGGRLVQGTTLSTVEGRQWWFFQVRRRREIEKLGREI